MALLLKNFPITLLVRYTSCFQNVLKITKYRTLFRHLASLHNVQNSFWPALPILGINPKSYLCRNEKLCFYSDSNEVKPNNLDSLVQYENVAEETMQSLYDRFEILLQDSKFEDWDANYSNGVLTVMLEENYTYVINKQTPNRQIWLSSPISGPKRYDYINGAWIYKHDGMSLHQLLSTELTDTLQTDATFYM